MSSLTKDPLLSIAKIVLVVFLGAIGVAGVALTAALIGLPFYSGLLLEKLAEQNSPVGSQLIWALAGIFILAIVLVAIAFYFFALLRRIVNSVGDGDPFIAENATRLTHMAWASLAGQLTAIPLTAVATYIGKIASDAGKHVNYDISFPIDGLLMVLILFILARVFRKGTEMREELEGTV
ncbi:DUF2975 domain-containing protein [Altererythrobacter indicus]|uniref:DUF2975 domain-containing protein n=1 Tax=Altericroceibacterium indicum TaxID=374177 RepID=A0A845ABB7_9SPHN|nr:DUF2975 domain-containing protein [Altericroceibacterium indicum]MXP26984.1 DUF2975 domain-containing protein [Altericroceibacterium indicum]